MTGSFVTTADITRDAMDWGRAGLGGHPDHRTRLPAHRARRDDHRGPGPRFPTATPTRTR